MWFKTGSVVDSLIFGGQHELIAWFFGCLFWSKISADNGQINGLGW